MFLLGSMLSPTHQRIFATGTVAVLTVVILLTLSNIRDTRTASKDSLALLSGDTGDTAKAQVYDATKNPVIHTPWDDQDTAKSPVGEASPFPIATPSTVDAAIPITTPAPNEPRRAFVTFLEADTGTNHDDQTHETDSDNEDAYFVGMSCLPSKLIFSNH